MPDNPGPLINGRSAFWQINIGHIGVAVCGLVSASILWATTVNRIGNLEAWRVEDKAKVAAVEAESKIKVEAAAAELAIRHKALVDTVERMNKEGTQASQRGIYQESDFSHSTERRVQAVEKTMADLSSQLSSINATVARCDERLQWLTRERTITTGSPVSRR